MSGLIEPLQDFEENGMFGTMLVELPLQCLQSRSQEGNGGVKTKEINADARNGETFCSPGALQPAQVDAKPFCCVVVGGVICQG